MDARQVLAAHGIGVGKKGVVPSLVPLFENQDSRNGTVDADLSAYSYGTNTRNFNKYDKDGNFVYQVTLTSDAWNSDGVMASPDAQKIFSGISDSGVFARMYEVDPATGSHTIISAMNTGSSAWIPLAVGPNYELIVWYSNSIRKYNRNGDGTYTQEWAIAVQSAPNYGPLHIADDGTLMIAYMNGSQVNCLYINPDGTVQKTLVCPESVYTNTKFAFNTKTKAYMAVNTSGQIFSYNYNNTLIYKGPTKASSHPQMIVGSKGYAYFYEEINPIGSADARTVQLKKIDFDGNVKWRTICLGDTAGYVGNPYIPNLLPLISRASFWCIYYTIQE